MQGAECTVPGAKRHRPSFDKQGQHGAASMCVQHDSCPAVRPCRPDAPATVARASVGSRLKQAKFDFPVWDVAARMTARRGLPPLLRLRARRNEANRQLLFGESPNLHSRGDDPLLLAVRANECRRIGHQLRTPGQWVRRKVKLDAVGSRPA
jgi:hypothetical protein